MGSDIQLLFEVYLRRVRWPCNLLLQVTTVTYFSPSMIIFRGMEFLLSSLSFLESRRTLKISWSVLFRTKLSVNYTMESLEYFCLIHKTEKYSYSIKLYAFLLIFGLQWIISERDVTREKIFGMKHQSII
jgi:hypothetical protein